MCVYIYIYMYICMYIDIAKYIAQISTATNRRHVRIYHALFFCAASTAEATISLRLGPLYYLYVIEAYLPSSRNILVLHDPYYLVGRAAARTEASKHP